MPKIFGFMMIPDRQATVHWTAPKLAMEGSDVFIMPVGAFHHLIRFLLASRFHEAWGSHATAKKMPPYFFNIFCL